MISRTTHKNANRPPKHLFLFAYASAAFANSYYAFTASLSTTVRLSTTFKSLSSCLSSSLLKFFEI